MGLSSKSAPPITHLGPAHTIIQHNSVTVLQGRSQNFRILTLSNLQRFQLLHQATAVVAMVIRPYKGALLGSGIRCRRGSRPAELRRVETHLEQVLLQILTAPAGPNSLGPPQDGDLDTTGVLNFSRVNRNKGAMWC